MKLNSGAILIRNSLTKNDDLYVNDEPPQRSTENVEPKMLPLRPIIRGPYGENADDDEHSSDTTIVYTEQHTEVKLNCEVDLDIAAVVWMHNGQVSNFISLFSFVSLSNVWCANVSECECVRTKNLQEIGSISLLYTFNRMKYTWDIQLFVCLHRKFNLFDTFYENNYFFSNKISNNRELCFHFFFSFLHLEKNRCFSHSCSEF